MRAHGPTSVGAGTPASAADPADPALVDRLRAAIDAAGGWLPFDRFMAIALYEPGLGYYANAGRKFGRMPGSGSDFVTAPEMSPLFGRTLARPLAQALAGSGTREIWEFGAGSGALAVQLLDALDAAADAGTAPRVERYVVVELSAALRERQRERLARFGDRVRWVDALPERIDAVVVGNELLDALPVTLVAFDGVRWHERGVVLAGPDDIGAGAAPFAWNDRPTTLRPPVADEIDLPAGYLTELHPQAEAFVATLGERLGRGAVYLVDYGFPAAEYYHPQRAGGTLMCHRAHRADPDPLAAVGRKDITAHVDFTGIALAAQDAGLELLGYTSQANFLIECGIGALMDAGDLATRADAARLLVEHEMGELFKVIAFATPNVDRAFATAPLGFGRGDRSHRL